MFIIDDLLLRLLGFSLQPFDMIWLLELMKNYGLKEKYSLRELNNQIKESRLLFELGELSKEEYEEKHKLLLGQLEKAKEINENLSCNMEIREIG